MPATTVVLTDQATGRHLLEYHQSGEYRDASGAQREWSVSKRTVRGGPGDGLDLIDVDSGRLKLTIIPTRGMGVWRAWCDGVEAGWKSPVEVPVHPKYVDQDSRGGLGWLAGFNELVCRCGLASHGPPGIDPGGNPVEGPLTLHGRIANTPAHQVEVTIDEDAGTLAVTGVVDETMLFGPCLRLRSTLTMRFGSDRFEIDDEITNLAAQPGEYEMLYHINVGRPFLDAGSRLDAAVAELIPRDPRAAEGVTEWSVYGGPETDYQEQAYFARLITAEDGSSPVLLRNPAGDRGFSLSIDCRTLPHFVLWKNTRAEADGYVTGLEPATSLPNHRSFEREQGRLQSLQPGETHRLRFAASVLTAEDRVSAVQQEIERLQGDQSPLIHDAPQPDWSPVVE